MMSVQDLMEWSCECEIVEGGVGGDGEQVVNRAGEIRLQALRRERADGTQAHGGADLPAQVQKQK